MAEVYSNKYELVIRGSVQQLSTVRCHRFGAYYGGYDHFLPWVSLPSSLETYLDDLNDIPLEYKKGGVEDPMELANTYFLVLAERQSEHLGAGLIVIPAEKNPGYFRRIGMFKGLPLPDAKAKELDKKYLEIISHLEWTSYIFKRTSKRIARALYRKRRSHISVTRTVRLI